MGSGEGQGRGGSRANLPEAARRMFQDAVAAARMQAEFERERRASLTMRIPTAPTLKAMGAIRSWRLFVPRAETYTIELVASSQISRTTGSRLSLKSPAPSCSLRRARMRTLDAGDAQRKRTSLTMDSLAGTELPEPREAEPGFLDVPHRLGETTMEYVAAIVRSQVEDVGGLLLEAPPETVCERQRYSCSPPALERTRTFSCGSSAPEIDTVHIVDCDSPYKRIMEPSWCMLARNLDLAEYALCLAVPDFDNMNRAIDGVREFLRRGWPFRLELRCWTEAAAASIGETGTAWNSNVDEPYVLQALANLTGMEAVNIIRNSDVLSTWMCGTEADRLCIVAQYASIIFHEILHTFGEAFNHPDPGNTCDDVVELAQNTFLWGLLKRYTITDSGCCEFADPLDALALNPVSTGISADCADCPYLPWDRPNSGVGGGGFIPPTGQPPTIQLDWSKLDPREYLAPDLEGEDTIWRP